MLVQYMSVISIVSSDMKKNMSDPTLLTTVTKPDASSTATQGEGILSRLTSSTSSLLWLLVVLLVVAVIFLYMWRRADRIALLATRRAQLNLITTDQCAAIVEESLLEYDRQRNSIIQDPTTTSVHPTSLVEDGDDQGLGDDDGDNDDNDELSLEEEDEEETSTDEEEEEEEEDEYDRVMSSDPAPPPVG